MSRANQPTQPKPWLTVRKADYPGALPTRLDCGACGSRYRPQSPEAAANWLRDHRLHSVERWAA